MTKWRKARKKPIEKTLLPLGVHLQKLIEHPISLKDFEENYTHEWSWTPSMFMDFLYLFHLHREELKELKKKLEKEGVEAEK